MKICFTYGLGLAMAGGLMASEPVRVHYVVRSDVRSGRLIRSAIVSPKVITATPVPSVAPPAEAAEPPELPRLQGDKLQQLVSLIARRHELDEYLVDSVVRVESNYNPAAVSSKGALGLMQLIPSTARRFGVANVFNPVQNVEGGVKYLKYLLDLYQGNEPLALAAYNAGEGAVARYGGIPPYSETRSYVMQVGKKLGDSRRAALAASKPQQTKAAEAKKESPPAPAYNATPVYNPIQAVESDGKLLYITR